jgi:hypothetical protein
MTQPWIPHLQALNAHIQSASLPTWHVLIEKAVSHTNWAEACVKADAEVQLAFADVRASCRDLAEKIAQDPLRLQPFEIQAQARQRALEALHALAQRLQVAEPSDLARTPVKR